MTTKGKRPMRAVTPCHKIEAIQRVNDGESKASVARDIGVPESTLRGWCKNEDKLRYMTARLSSPDTDRSNDSEPPDKRARTISPAASSPPAPSGLDLTAPATVSNTVQLPAQHPIDAPIELTTKRNSTSPTQRPHATPRELRPDPNGSVSMNAISQLSGLVHLPGLAHSHLGINFNEIANNLTFLAQLNPGLSALTTQPSSLLRSVRSPKPAHNGVLNLNDSRHRSRHHSDPYRHAPSTSSHHGSGPSVASQSIDDSLLYWLKTHQAMLDLTTQPTATYPLQLGKATDPTGLSKPVAPAMPIINPHLDYNRNNWLWQYYKQLGGTMPLPNDRHKSVAHAPKDKTAENILYSQLTKGKMEVDRGTTSSAERLHPPGDENRGAASEDSRNCRPVTSPEITVDGKETPAERGIDSAKNQTKARTVLDTLLFNNSSPSTVTKETRSENAVNGEWEAGAAEALEHGDKFLSWLEVSGDPSVTRMHVHQLRALLQNLRARRTPLAPAPAPAHAEPIDHTTRRK